MNSLQLPWQSAVIRFQSRFHIQGFLLWRESTGAQTSGCHTCKHKLCHWATPSAQLSTYRVFLLVLLATSCSLVNFSFSPLCTLIFVNKLGQKFQSFSFVGHHTHSPCYVTYTTIYKTFSSSQTETLYPLINNSTSSSHQPLITFTVCLCGFAFWRHFMNTKSNSICPFVSGLFHLAMSRGSSMSQHEKH